MKEKLRHFIMQLCDESPKLTRGKVIKLTTEAAIKMKAMEDQEIDDWVKVITEMVNNYY